MGLYLCQNLQIFIPWLNIDDIVFSHFQANMNSRSDHVIFIVARLNFDAFFSNVFQNV